MDSAGWGSSEIAVPGAERGPLRPLTSGRGPAVRYDPRSNGRWGSPRTSPARRSGERGPRKQLPRCRSSKQRPERVVTSSSSSCPSLASLFCLPGRRPSVMTPIAAQLFQQRARRRGCESNNRDRSSVARAGSTKFVGGNTIWAVGVRASSPEPLDTDRFSLTWLRPGGSRWYGSSRRDRSTANRLIPSTARRGPLPASYSP